METFSWPNPLDSTSLKRVRGLGRARQSIMPLFASDDDIGDLGDMADVVCVMGVVAVIAAVGESEALVLGRRRAAVEGAAAAAAATASSKRART